MQEGVAGLLRDKTRPSRIPPLGADAAERVVALTLKDPPTETTHWTAVMMARQTGLSESSVRRIWRAHGLQPHRVRRFKLSNDPDFVSKLRDVVGLYVDPPAHAVVLSVDEKSQIQALDRNQPGLPLKKGRARTSCWKYAFGMMTYDYKRNGTTTLFAALNALDGAVIHCRQAMPRIAERGKNMQRHPLPGSASSSDAREGHQEFIRFLNEIEQQVPAGKAIHAILPVGECGHSPVGRGTTKRRTSIPRFGPGSTATHAGRSTSSRHRARGSTPPLGRLLCNHLPGNGRRLFAKLAKRRLNRGVFHSLIDLQAAINRFLVEHNATEAKPFRWTADPDKIIDAVRRGHQMLESDH